MKNFIFLLTGLNVKPGSIFNYMFFILITTNSIQVIAQTSGYIRYEEKVDQWKLTPPSRQYMNNNIPQFSTTIYRLYFSPTESIYKGYVEDRPVYSPGFGPRPGAGNDFVVVDLTREFYTNETMMIAQLEIFGHTYYTSDTISTASWKFGDDTRTILGYECKLAYYTDNTNPDAPLEITAWYSPKIRALIGPEQFNTLPGAILALDINGGDRFWIARKIELRELTADEKITVPIEKKKSIKVSYKECQRILAEETKKLRDRFK